MFLSTKSIGEVVASLRGKTRYIGLKSPSNFKLKEFEDQINATRLEKLNVVISRKKQSFWVFTLYEFRSPLRESIVTHLISRWGSSSHAFSRHESIRYSETPDQCCLFLAVSFSPRGGFYCQPDQELQSLRQSPSRGAFRPGRIAVSVLPLPSAKQAVCPLFPVHTLSPV